jgi:hypothetical protein
MRSPIVTGHHATGAWISAHAATILCWSPEVTARFHVDSTVPDRHRSTGRAPTDRAGDDGRRDEHLRTFFEAVARALPADDDLLLVGDGEVVDHFAVRIRGEDEAQGRVRRVEVAKSGPISDAQLIARIRAFAGSPPKRVIPR